jgi:Ca2+-binding RTX toxin-like protein
VTLGDGNDTFNGRGGTTLGTVQGGNGNDTFIIDTGDVTIEGGTGFDTVFSTASYKMGLDVEVLNLQGLQGLTGIGRGANEFITGSDGNDTLLGRGGDDNLNGGEGDNLLQGGQGNDVLAMTNGSSTLDGGGGVDFVILLPGLDAVRSVVNLASGTATSLDAADDVVATATLQGIENVGGSTGNDSITGTRGANILTGSLGFDTLSGGDGNDSQDGGNDADSLSGGKGDDTLYGNFGADTLNGGTGADVFQFLSTAESPVGASDLIADFTTASDRIDISAIDADVVAGGDQAFVFVGTAAFAGPGAQVRMVQDAGAGTTTVQLRLAGSVATSMEFVLTGVVNLTAAHFDL